MRLPKPPAELNSPTHQAQWSLLAAQRDYLLRLANHLTENPQIAEDMVHDTLLTAFEKYQQFDQRAQLRTWLTRMLKNRLTDYWRSSKKWVALPEAHEYNLDDLDILFTPSNHWDNSLLVQWHTPEQGTQQRQFIDILDWCAAMLPAKTRQAFMMSHLLDCPSEEIASQLAIQTNHLWVLLYRARMSLKLCLEQHWFLSSPLPHNQQIQQRIDTKVVRQEPPSL